VGETKGKSGRSKRRGGKRSGRSKRRGGKRSGRSNKRGGRSDRGSDGSDAGGDLGGDFGGIGGGAGGDFGYGGPAGPDYFYDGPIYDGPIGRPGRQGPGMGPTIGDETRCRFNYGSDGRLNIKDAIEQLPPKYQFGKGSIYNNRNKREERRESDDVEVPDVYKAQVGV
jgi:hypothetical protein